MFAIDNRHIVYDTRKCMPYYVLRSTHLYLFKRVFSHTLVVDSTPSSSLAAFTELLQTQAFSRTLRRVADRALGNHPQTVFTFKVHMMGIK